MLDAQFLASYPPPFVGWFLPGNADEWTPLAIGRTYQHVVGQLRQLRAAEGLYDVTANARRPMAPRGLFFPPTPPRPGRKRRVAS